LLLAKEKIEELLKSHHHLHSRSHACNASGTDLWGGGGQPAFQPRLKCYTLQRHGRIWGAGLELSVFSHHTQNESRLAETSKGYKLFLLSLQLMAAGCITYPKEDKQVYKAMTFLNLQLMKVKNETF
jgi:hypothetical protein